MSRIGKMPVSLPKGVTVAVRGSVVEVKGSKGTLTRDIPSEVDVAVEGDQVVVKRVAETKRHRAFHGLVRNLVANMVQGVSVGFTRTLEINGVGYRAQVKGRELELNLGFSQPVIFPLKEGVEAKVDKNNIILSGINKETVGQVAADIRALRPPEPYKGKGIKYVEERIVRKAGKTTK
ncbi:MAG: 50S ribosomal protein L6 [bacterium]|nr:50S ribosomal protein L6 [bacterium]